MTTMTASSPAPAAAGNAAMGVHAGTREYLSFKLGAEEYGIDILKVQEIRGYEPPTRIANAPEFIKGVVNLRGVIVPIVDMRVRFGLDEVKYDSFTVVIILNIAGRTIGMVVDSVSDVVELAHDQIRPLPAFNAHAGANGLMAHGVDRGPTGSAGVTRQETDGSLGLNGLAAGGVEVGALA